ncbi:hypothetical protein BGZ80_002956 [Entomortierella chlamydospora]|uniref:Uncharacterized protein n=1 Tax=Entomortierella chlamydospora TaxID=101097 RepID=A0A9P6MP60_9FUNG|nr:hypothetical protein BGZ80_002956 [Entomortierella chlamydospora]
MSAPQAVQDWMKSLGSRYSERLSALTGVGENSCRTAIDFADRGILKTGNFTRNERYNQISKIDDAIENIIKDERAPFTMNKYHYDNILNSRKAKAEQHIQQQVNKVLSNNHYGTNYSGQSVNDILKQQLRSYGKFSQMSDVGYNE